jgi:prepilin-type N-terminal cleavage/methylation domain-containing protein
MPADLIARRAFTLVELLVVIGIIVVLLAILLPSLELGAESGKRTKCASNLGAIGKAIAMYVNDSESNLYPQTSSGATLQPTVTALQAKQYYMLLGQLGEVPGYNDPAFHDTDKRPLNRYLGASGAGTEVKAAQCPSDAGGQAVLDPNKDYNFSNDNGGVDN